MSLRVAIVFAVFASLVASGSNAFALNDPRLLWKSIQTAHFRITYYSTEDEVAAHVAALAEAIYQRLVPAVGWSPADITDILLTDQTDSANGSATAIPYNAVRLYVTAPDDMSPLGDVDDWYLELLTHEYTHILHTDHMGWFWHVLNRVLGKTFAPNQMQPRWLLEGLAVFEESVRTSGGRLRSSMWNMFMRADVLEDNVAPLDVFSHGPRRWPQGNIVYLYGSFFMKWIADTYGEQAVRAMIDDYGNRVVPYGVNRSIRRATGRTFEELYPAWIDSLRRSFDAQASAIRRRGLREGLQITHTGQTVEHPRWVPANAWPDHAGDLVSFVDDAHTTAGYWALPLLRNWEGKIVAARENARELVVRSGIGGLSFLPDGGAVFSSPEVHNNLFLFDDLFELPAHQKSPGGLDGHRARWSDGWRALDPSVSSDGRRVVFTTNHRGTTSLMMADVVASADRAGTHAVANAHVLVPSGRFDQAFTPRWAPDDRHVAYSSWQRGGYRDVRIVDTADGSFREVTHDRAIDGDPVFSADGRWLYFHSDRTGVTNIYAYEVATDRIRQVTNVINGAYQPEPSPDGKLLAYVGYTHAGYDLFVMPVDESQWLDAMPAEETRGAPPAEPPQPLMAPVPYNPWPTLQPRSYSIQSTPGNFGQAYVLRASGSDIAGLHQFNASITTEEEHPELEATLAYGYTRLPFDFGASVYRLIAPQSNYQLGSNTLRWVEEIVGGTTSLSYAIPRAFDSQAFNIAYSVARVAGDVPLPADRLNPYDTPKFPPRGTLGSLHLGWSYSNAEAFLWSIGSEKGFDLGVAFDLTDPALGSDFTGYATTVNFSTYFQMPWLRHHALALHAGMGTSGGDAGGHGLFYVGGFIDLPVINVVQNLLYQSGAIVLRGYPVFAEVGKSFGLANAEYRFPIVNVDRGPSTLPIFLNRISGAAFTDYGSAFDDARTAKFKTGVGAELWFDLTLGYTLGFTFRSGFAKGLASGGVEKTYFVAAVPF
ncbi:MAG TPA: hypothetical protein VGY54_02735 [Polyangiaceae bacterium]|nr:hypothetical protein [Polyangiaceae bacterium]